MSNYVDAAATMEKISELETKLQELREENQNLKIEIENFKSFVSSIPVCFPDGSPAISCYGWLGWAKTQLGYDNEPD